MKRIISLLSAALLVAGSKAADIRGYVVDAETGEALAAANVFITQVSDLDFEVEFIA